MTCKLKFSSLFVALLLLLAPLAIPSVHAQQATTIILVRHAEKADDGTADPGLSETGIARAALLRSQLSAADITAIYSTPYKRTRQTVRPLAEEKGVAITDYNTFGATVLRDMLSAHPGGTILVAGHSNTTPKLVNLLLGTDRYRPLDESAYDNIFIVYSHGLGKGKLLHLKYQEPVPRTAHGPGAQNEHGNDRPHEKPESNLVP